MEVTPYLYFKGTCETALKFYEACGLGKIQEVRRIEGTPLETRDGPGWRDKVLHSVFEGPGLRLYASDGPDSEPMKGCAIFIEIDSPDAAAALFEALSAGGRVTVPFKRQFWGIGTAISPISSAYSGRLADPRRRNWRLLSASGAAWRSESGPGLPTFCNTASPQLSEVHRTCCERRRQGSP
jgi:PhnB protein